MTEPAAEPGPNVDAGTAPGGAFAVLDRDEGLPFLIADAGLSVQRVLNRIDASDAHELARFDRIKKTIDERGGPEIDAAREAEVAIGVPLATLFLYWYLNQWYEGGATATADFCCRFSELELDTRARGYDLLMAARRALEPLALLELGGYDEDQARGVSRALVDAALMLESAGHLNDALACCASAVSVTDREDRDLLAAIDLTFRLSTAAGTNVGPLVLIRAAALVVRARKDPAYRLQASDAVEGALRHIDLSGISRAEVLRVVESLVNDSDFLTWAICFAPLIPVAPGSGERSVGEGVEGVGIGDHGLLDQAVEEQSSVLGAAAVEAEGELVEVVVQLVVADGALVGAQQPALE